MNQQEAVKAAQDWLEIRREVRAVLIQAAREAHPHEEYAFAEWESSEVRKLYQYPSDLSEERLLNLTGNENG